MTPNDVLILNLDEIRRRSLKVWAAIPADSLDWRPDSEAMTCIEMVRHVLEGEIHYMWMLQRGGSLASDNSPFTGRPLTTVDDDVAFELPYRRELIEMIRSFTSDDLSSRKIDRSDKGYVRTAADFILRMGFHEAVHTGHMLSYLRSIGVARPNIWD